MTTGIKDKEAEQNLAAKEEEIQHSTEGNDAFTTLVVGSFGLALSNYRLACFLKIPLLAVA